MLLHFMAYQVSIFVTTLLSSSVSTQMSAMIAHVLLCHAIDTENNNRRILVNKNAKGHTRQTTYTTGSGRFNPLSADDEHYVKEKCARPTDDENSVMT